MSAPRPMTVDEQIAAMRNAGVGEPAITRWLANQDFPRWQADRGSGGYQGVAAAIVQVVGPTLPFPIRLTLPWTALVSDNDREKASMFTHRGVMRPRKLLTLQYKAARSRIVEIGHAAMRVGATTFQPLEQPLSLVAHVWVPGGSSRNDICNFAKGVHDALQKIVYRNDAQLVDTRWVRAGIDVDRPRAEITIAPLSP